MARKQNNTGMQRAEFPARPSESEDLPGSSSRAEDAEPREDTEPRRDTEVSETGPREVEPTARTSQQPHTQIVLPRHTSISGMDPSFINYFREHVSRLGILSLCGLSSSSGCTFIYQGKVSCLNILFIESLELKYVEYSY